MQGSDVASARSTGVEDMRRGGGWPSRGREGTTPAPSLNGLEATRQILKTNPEAKVLILTLHESEQMVREVLNAGARGFVLKSDAARDLVFAVEALAHDKTYFTSKVSTIVLDGYLRGGMTASEVMVGHHRLTAREREIIQLIAEGKSSKEIAVALGLSVKTAETHRSNIMRKQKLHSVSELVLYAVRNNIVQVPGSYDGLPSAA